jgi:ribosomal protein S12 methylthiotransferase
MKRKQQVRVGLVVLGCDKNTVDSEYLAASLARRGALVTADPIRDGPVDAVVIATCGFTDEARRQSIATILEWAGRKRTSPHPMRLYIWSCLGQRWAGELLEAIPEIDGIAGVGRFEQLATAILDETGHKQEVVPSGAPFPTQHSTLKTQHTSFPPSVQITRGLARLRLDRRPYAFLKIADGCNHRCTFCAIPLMKGRLRSVPRRILLEEARALLDSGAREINLIAQDLTDYGRDLYRRYRLPDLLEDLLVLEGDFWVRLLYVYPGGLNERLVELLASHPKLCPYLDLPLQHLDVGVLRRMRRPKPSLDVERLVERLRERIPNLALRTTMMVGFPGEDRAAFERLLDGVRRIRFDRLGAFVFSRESGTAAFTMADQPSPATAVRRLDRLMGLQAAISAELGRSRIGQTVRVLVERAPGRPDSPRADAFYIGRTARDAPEVDGVVKFRSPHAVEIGSFVEVRITGAETYDLSGEVRSEK